jgi:peptidyl-prolyl cis-trans isomerase A (cyclophilin A)
LGSKKLPDEPRLQKNLKGTYHLHGAERTTGQHNSLSIPQTIHSSINTIKAGVKGYTPVAKVIRGMEIVAKFEAGYGIRTGNHPGFIIQVW